MEAADGSAELKRKAALAALDLVEPGMKLGLGTGSTAKLLVEALGKRVAEGLDLVCVPTSEATRAQAEALGVRLTTLDETPALDLTIDGADEIDPQLRLIKGGGGALLREKIVAFASARMVVIADQSKRVNELGRFPLPVEVTPFGHGATRLRIQDAARSVGLAGEITLRQRDGRTFVTDGGNYIYDCAFGRIAKPERLAEALATIPGVVEHGLFIGFAQAAFVGTPEGVIRISADGDREQ
ncbi:ribose-5-phosphate isomerase RpiA [Rhodoligotrophos defluvii]|uniref:ribose-5-phosphate isomerase RpiA n=1 Tax=Rhodoligotrophos defluvii TaxID=2561934 RepID=UPI0010C9E8EA|nr:ribose-5-phosphate isomerase RpiA [Rhodoligotrophos defluvii]